MFAAWWRRWRSGAKPLGPRGEDAAATYLQKLGYKIVERGKRFRFGEIDLIAADGRTLVFCEVKTRRSTDRGRPDEAVDVRKQRKITRAALAYLKANRLLDHPCRFDVIAVVWSGAAAEPEIRHFRHAFEAQGPRSMFS